MEKFRKDILLDVILLTKSSEKKFKEGDFKGAIEEKRQVKIILNSRLCDKDIKEKYKDQLHLIYDRKFDLIFDYKLRINQDKKNKIIKALEHKSEDRYQKGDYKGAIKALRRSEKFL